MSSSTERSRIAADADCDEVAELLDRFQVEFDEYTPGAEALAPRVREHIARDLSVFLLAGPGRVGVAQLRFREYLHTGRPICYLEELYVVPERRRQGHGRTLMQAALDVARERGATSMELGTAVNDGAARALYESLGFTNLEKAGRPETQMLFYEREL
jgi:ribosomal protein S18 acetylase RimI-like enzyme